MSNLSLQQIESLSRKSKLDETQFQLLKLHLKNRKIKKAHIRNVLSEEGQNMRQGFYIIEGTLNVVAKLQNQQKIVISQIGNGEVANIDLPLNHWISKNSLVVSTSTLYYITLTEQELLLLTSHIQDQIEILQRTRAKYLHQQNIKIAISISEKKKQNITKKLSLPHLKPLRKNQEISLNAEIQNTEIKSQQLSKEKALNQIFTYFSKEIKSKVAKYPKSLTNLHFQNSQKIQSYEEQQLKNISKEILEKYHQKSAIAKGESRISNVKRQKLHTLSNKVQSEVERNQKIFKDKLKYIVKRKLMFERKHFKVLKAFRNHEQKEIVEILKNQEVSDKHQIDNYFKF